MEPKLKDKILHEKLIQLVEDWDLLSRRHGRVVIRHAKDLAIVSKHRAHKLTYENCAKDLKLFIGSAFVPTQTGQ